jgi:heme exporter protein A
VTAPLLAVRGLSKRFGAVTALRGVDLELERGGALAILGPNGAGKSTLLRAIAGLAHPTSGEVRIEGYPSPRTAVGYLGHSTLLSAELTARENLVFAGRLHGVADPGARADRLLAEEGLADVAMRRTGGFSRGMAQRLSIARARVHNPELLLLDEPYTGLDHRSAGRLTDRLRALHTEGHSLVMVTHAVEQAAALAKRVVILVAGRVVRHAGGGDVTAEHLERLYAEALDEPAPGIGA